MTPAVFAWVLSIMGAASFFVAGIAVAMRRAKPSSGEELPAVDVEAREERDRLQQELTRTQESLRSAESRLATTPPPSPEPAPADDGHKDEEIEQLRANLKAAADELESGRAAATESSSEQSSLELRLGRATKQCSALSTERDTLAAGLRELEASSAESSARLREALSAQSSDFEACQGKLEHLAVELRRQRQAQREQTAEQDEIGTQVLKAEREKAEESLRGMEAVEAAQERTIREQSTRLSLAQEEIQRLSRERDQLQVDAESSTGAAAADSDDVERLQREVSVANEALESRGRALDESRDEVAHLKAAAEEAPATDEGLERLQREIGVANEALDARTRALEESRDEIARLKVAADTPASDSEHLEQLERTNREVAALKEDLEAKKGSVEETREELARLRNIAVELSATEEARVQLETELESLRAEFAAAQTAGTTAPMPAATAAVVVKPELLDEPVSTMGLQELIDDVEALRAVRAAAVADTSGLVVVGAGNESEVLSALASTLFSAAERAQKELPIGSPVEFSVLDASGFTLRVQPAESQFSRLLFVTLSKGAIEAEQSVQRLVAAIPRVSV